MQDFFGILDAVKRLTAPAGLENAHQDGFSWARDGVDFITSTKLTADDWNRIIAQLRGVLTATPGFDPTGRDPSDPLLLRDAIIDFATAKIDEGIVAQLPATVLGNMAAIVDAITDVTAFVVPCIAGSAGTANAVIATTDFPIPDFPVTALFILAPLASNTGAMTLAINGGAAKPLVTNSGGSMPSGSLSPGMVAAFIDNGDDYRLLSDVASGAIQAAAETAANASSDNAVASQNSALESAANAALTAADKIATAADAASADANALAAVVAKNDAQAARDAAISGSIATWPTTVSGIGQGIAGVTSIVGGSGGTNGTFALAFSGGTQVIAPVGVFTVSGGALVSVVITHKGYYSAGTPTLSFAASSGLTGASATAQMAANTPLGRYFTVPVSGSTTAANLYQVTAGPAATLITTLLSGTFRDEISAQRGDVAAATALRTITKPGEYWLVSGSGYTDVPADFVSGANHWLTVEQAGSPTGTGSDRWIRQEITTFALTAADTLSNNFYRRSWERILDTSNPGTSTGDYAWVKTRPPIGETMLADNYDYRGDQTNIDFNTVFKSGVYLVTDLTPTNGPPGMTTGLLTISNRQNNWIEQKYTSLTDATIGYVRICQNTTTTFHPWEPLRPGLAGGKTIVCLGDSITENGGSNQYTTLLAREANAVVINGGFGGARMGQHGTPGIGYDMMSMHQLSGMIASNDFSGLITAADYVWTNFADDNRVVAANVDAIDWVTVDILTIWFGRNDKTGNVPIGLPSDATGATFKGAINKIVTDIATAHPKIRLVFVSTLYSNDSPNTLGLTQRDYADAIIERAMAHNCQVIDMYHLLGVNSINYSFYMADSSHPKFIFAGGGEGNFNTTQRIAEIIAGQINAPSVTYVTTRSSTIALTADNQSVPVGDLRTILLTSNNATAANRTFLLGPGAMAGQEVTLIWDDTDAGELIDGSASGSGVVRLSADWTPTQYDTLTLIWAGADWVEKSRSAN